MKKINQSNSKITSLTIDHTSIIINKKVSITIL